MNKQFTEKETMDAAFIVGMTEGDAEEFFNHYNAQGWVRGNGLPITNLVSAIKIWRNNMHKHPKPETSQDKWARIDRKKAEGLLP